MKNNNNCQTCGATFYSQDELKEHQRMEHSRYECDSCGHVFDSQDRLDKHVRDMHPEQESIPGR